MSGPTEEALAGFVGFTQALQREGVRSASAREFVAALGSLDPMRRLDVYWAGRATLCASADDIDIYDRVFADWFSGVNVGAVQAWDTVTVSSAPMGDGEGGGLEEADDIEFAASRTEVLRQRDVATMTPAQRRHLAMLFASLNVRVPRRTVRRHGPWHRGTIDVRATVREQMRRHGELGPLSHRRQRQRPRRVVFLIDVSRSMTPYADHMLRLAHRVVRSEPRLTEVFTMGTRLTRISRALDTADPDEALRAAGQVIPDWSGGTRLAEGLGAFTNRWGRRGVARGSVVVILSDGWERGDCADLGIQAGHLARLAHRIIWVNPHRGKPGYEPVQAGIVAVLPHIDHLVAGHSFETFAEVLDVIGAV